MKGGNVLREALIRSKSLIASEVKAQLEASLISAKPRHTWTTGEGVTMLMRDMEESHLRNSIAYSTRRLMSAIGKTVWMSDVKKHVIALGQLIEEAERRGLRV